VDLGRGQGVSADRGARVIVLGRLRRYVFVPLF
jgi:hypothetical protein